MIGTLETLVLYTDLTSMDGTSLPATPDLTLSRMKLGVSKNTRSRSHGTKLADTATHIPHTISLYVVYMSVMEQ